MGSENQSAIEEALDALEDQWVGTARARAELSALRAENARMREALEKCLNVLAGRTMTKQELIDALRSASAALGGRDE